MNEKSKKDFLRILNENLEILKNASNGGEIDLTDFMYNILYDINELVKHLTIYKMDTQILKDIWGIKKVYLGKIELINFSFRIPNKNKVDDPKYNICNYILNGDETFKIENDILYII